MAMVQPAPATAAIRIGPTAAPDRADIGNKAHHRRDDPPHHRARHADHRQRAADDDAETDIEQHLRDEIARQPVGGVAHRRRRALQVAGADEADEAVAQVLALHEDENDEDRHERGGGQRRSGGAGIFLQDRQDARRRRHDLDRYGCLRLGLEERRLLLRRLGFRCGLSLILRGRRRGQGGHVRDAGDEIVQLADDRVSRRELAQALCLAGDGDLVARGFGGEVGNLLGEDRAQADRDEEGSTARRVRPRASCGRRAGAAP